MSTELKKCSQCRCIMLTSYFSFNRRGELYKTCDKCRNKHKCEQCNYVCSSKSNLNIHIKQVHDKIRDIKCDQCNYVCSRNSTLNKHIKIVHDKIKDFECDQCDYVCSTNSDLDRHIKQVHDKIRDIKCDQCDCVFSANSNLKQHIKYVHDKIKDFECDQCDYVCSTNHNLKLHKQRCTGESKLSSGEYACKIYLDKLQIDYEHNTSFELTNEKGNLIRWDFILTINNKKLFIEYNGAQHYKPQMFGGISKEKADEQFEIQRQRDKLRQEFCDDNEYPLLWIKYTDFKKIDDLILQFVLENSDWDGDRHD